MNTENNVNNGTTMQSPVVEQMMNEYRASEFDMPNCVFPQPNPIPCDGEGLDGYEYAHHRGRNQEYYKDPTYHTARRNNDGYFDSRRRRMDKPHDSVPVYFSTKSKRFELIGIIMRLCDIAGFELAERIVLKDKETGEIYR